MTSHSKLLRVSKSRPCPICGRADWCGVSEDGSICVCMRVEEGSVARTRNNGFLHRLGGDRPRSSAHRTTTVSDRSPSRHDLSLLVNQYRTAVDPARFAKLAASLSLSETSLKRLEAGWASDRRAWTFPMRDARGNVLGVRLRLLSGRKLSVTGGREGLFIPCDLPGRLDELFVTEGPTDCAALLDLGFAAVGRPSCTGGVSPLVELARTRRPASVVIVADADAPGLRGGAALAAVMRLHAPKVCVITPPAGIKDARAWKQAGATAADVRAAIDAAPPLGLRVSGTLGAKEAGHG